MDEAGVRTLRAKYLDWCSARIAERFLDLSPEEIYELAHAVPSGGAVQEGPGSSTSGGSQPRPPHQASSRPSSVDSPSSPSLPSADSAFPALEGPEGPPDRLPRPDDEGYRALVQRVTESLLEQMPLPTFEQWAEAYAEAPERFDPELLGFWKDVADEGERPGPS